MFALSMHFTCETCRKAISSYPVKISTMRGIRMKRSNQKTYTQQRNGALQTPPPAPISVLAQRTRRRLGQEATSTTQQGS